MEQERETEGGARAPGSSFQVAAPRVHGPVGELSRFATRPNLVAGLRGAVATLVPILAANALGIPGGEWAGLAGFTTALVDRGGAYRTRAEAMGALTITAAVAGGVAALAAGRPHIVIPLILVWATLGGLARAYGAQAGSVGLSATNTFIISLSAPAHGLEDAAQRTLLLVAGGVVAMALSLVLWPIRAYRPARQAVAACWRALADYADAVANGQPRDFRGFREALEDARATLAATRRGRTGETGRGERLLMLAEGADRTFTALAALGGALDSLPADSGASARERARATAATAARLARDLADAMERERHPAPAPLFPAGDRDAGESGAQLERLADAVQRQAKLGWAAAAGVESGRRVGVPEAPVGPRTRGALEILRENLTFRSVTFRHALRVGVAAATATAVGHLLGVERAYWITLTAMIVLQPSAGATWVKGVQRIGGTIAGGIVAAVIGALVHDSTLMLAIIFVGATAAVAMLRVNYAVYAAFLTPTFVLLAEIGAPDRHLPGVRIANTLVGGALALAAARVLWPAPERLAFAGRLAEALRACGAYIRAGVGVFAGTATRAEADEARRNTGLAVLNAEESLQLVLWEARAGDASEAGMAALALLRRIAEAANSLAYAPTAPGAAPPGTAEFGAAAERAMQNLALCVETRCPPETGVDLHAPSTGASADYRVSAIVTEIAALGQVLARGESATERTSGPPVEARA